MQNNNPQNNQIKNNPGNNIKEIVGRKTKRSNKRPISITFVSIYGVAFAIAVLINVFVTIDFVDFLYGLLILLLFFGIPLIIVFIVLMFFNLRRKKRRTIGFIIGAAVCIIIVPLSLVFGGLFEDQLTRADEYFIEKNYEVAAKYYDYVISAEEDASKIEVAKTGKEKSQDFIDEAKSHMKNGDIYFDHEIFSRAEEEYRKAYKIYPYLEDIDSKIKLASKMHKEAGSLEDETDYVLLNENLKFKHIVGFPSFWGDVKISDPFIAEFKNIEMEKGRFFESDNELKVSGQLIGKNEIEKFVESEKGLFVFISAAIVDELGSVKWYKDGYIKGDSPYVRSGEIKEFSLINIIDGSIEPKDTLIIVAYLKKSILVLINQADPESPNAEKNIFALYSVLIP